MAAALAACSTADVRGGSQRPMAPCGRGGSQQRQITWAQTGCCTGLAQLWRAGCLQPAALPLTCSSRPDGASWLIPKVHPKVRGAWTSTHQRKDDAATPVCQQVEQARKTWRCRRLKGHRRAETDGSRKRQRGNTGGHNGWHAPPPPAVGRQLLPGQAQQGYDEACCVEAGPVAAQGRSSGKSHRRQDGINHGGGTVCGGGTVQLREARCLCQRAIDVLLH